MTDYSKALQGGVAALLLLLSITFSIALFRDRAPRGIRGAQGGGDGLLVAISRKPALAFGFRNFLADLVWLEVVQVAGERQLAPADYDRVNVLLNATANFDPCFEIPYLVGGLILGESPSHASEALRILERGRKQYPRNWRLPFYIGYTYYFSLGDAVAGGRAMAEAAALPGSPAYLPRLASRMLVEGRDPETALGLLGAIEAHETDEARKDVIRRRIREVLVERDILYLEWAVAKYRGATGHLPGSLEELVGADLIPGIPREPNGGAYHLLPDGTVRSDRVKSRLKVFQAR